MFSEYPDNISRLSCHRPTPLPEPGVLVHRIHPLIEELALRFILVGILPFGFKN